MFYIFHHSFFRFSFLVILIILLYLFSFFFFFKLYISVTCSYNKNTDALGWRFSFTSLFAFPLFVFMFFFSRADLWSFLKCIFNYSFSSLFLFRHPYYCIWSFVLIFFYLTLYFSFWFSYQSPQAIRNKSDKASWSAGRPTMQAANHKLIIEAFLVPADRNMKKQFNLTSNLARV